MAVRPGEAGAEDVAQARRRKAAGELPGAVGEAAAGGAERELAVAGGEQRAAVAAREVEGGGLLETALRHARGPLLAAFVAIELRTPQPVSVKRLEKLWASLSA